MSLLFVTHQFDKIKMAIAKRQTAYRTWISSVADEKYIKQEGWDPNYIELDGKQVSRINILATVVAKFISEDRNYASLTLDDGTNTIRCKAFGPDVAKIKDVEIGAIVRFIGKLKEYNEELYLSPDVVKEIEDPNWLIVWKLELGKPPEIKTQKVSETEPKSAEGPTKPAEETNSESDQNATETEVMMINDENFSTKVLELIKKHDEGKGANIDIIIKESKLDEDEAKNIIIGLLKAGDIFEPRKGQLKAL